MKIKFLLILLMLVFAVNIAQAGKVADLERVSAENDSLHNLAGWTATTTVYIPSAVGTNMSQWDEVEMVLTMSNTGAGDSAIIVAQKCLGNDWTTIATVDTLIHGGTLTLDSYLDNETSTVYHVPMLATAFRYVITINDSTNKFNYTCLKRARD